MTYSLPDGQTAEFVLIVDDAKRGDGYLIVDGEAIVHSSYRNDDANSVDTWTSSDPGADALAEAALAGLAGEAGNELLDAFAGESRAFKCSSWGKKVPRAGKYIWGGLVTGAAAVCCIDTAGVACPVYAAGMGALG